MSRVLRSLASGQQEVMMRGVRKETPEEQYLSLRRTAAILRQRGHDLDMKARALKIMADEVDKMANELEGSEV